MPKTFKRRRGGEDGRSGNWCRSGRSTNSELLAESGMSVTLVARRQEQVNELNTKQLTRINVDGTKTVQNVVSTTDLATLPPQDLLVIAVKYGHLQKLYKQFAALSSDMPLLFMQNGLAHFEEALTLPQKILPFVQFLLVLK